MKRCEGSYSIRLKIKQNTKGEQMTSATFTKKDYETLLKLIREFHETDSIVASVDATKLIIKGILTNKLIIKML